MPREGIAIYGAGGHARVVLDILHRQGRVVTAIVDDRRDVQESMAGIAVTKFSSENSLPSAQELLWIVAVGDSVIRAHLVERLEALGFSFATAIDHSAQIGSAVSIQEGSVVMPNAVINSGSVIGRHVIINTASSVDHDCAIGDFCHVSPGCTLCGEVTVEHSVLLGVGVKVGPGVSIGAGSVVGAGAVLLESIPAGVKAWGVPARIIGETA